MNVDFVVKLTRKVGRVKNNFGATDFRAAKAITTLALKDSTD
jgi:hypothetical protein